MAAPVVIDMGMAEPADVLVASMVEACAKAVGDGGDCHLVRDAPQGPYRAIAILTWEGPDKVRIEVGLRRNDGTNWRTRALSFQPEDVEIERFRSVGFVVGTLATEEPPAAPPPPVEAPAPVLLPPKPKPPPPPLPKPAPTPRVRPASSIGLVGTMGGALDEGAPRYGGALRGRFGLSSWIGISTSAGGSVRPRDHNELVLRFLDAGVGLGFILSPPRPIGWELDVQAVVESFYASADAGGASDSANRILPAARVELELVWAVAPPVELLVGANLFARPASTTVIVGGEPVGTTGILEIGVVAGARFDL
jgi:hypothetical protein